MIKAKKKPEFKRTNLLSQASLTGAKKKNPRVYTPEKPYTQTSWHRRSLHRGAPPHRNIFRKGRDPGEKQAK